MTDDLPFGEPLTAANPAAAPRKCRRHDWDWAFWCKPSCSDAAAHLARQHQHMKCLSCGAFRDEAATRRGRNNRSRGGREELAVARILGGQKVGPLGLPHDVVLPGYMRVQTKKLRRWPSLAKVVGWLDAMAPGDDVRAVTVADTPGLGSRTRRLLIVDLDEYARWHGRETP